jgi:hypothetical protein
MDFIERMFGISPDGGNGLLEVLYLLSIVAAITLISHRLYVTRKRYPGSSRIIPNRWSCLVANTTAHDVVLQISQRRRQRGSVPSSRDAGPSEI